MILETLAVVAALAAPPSPMPNFRLDGDRWIVGPDHGGLLKGYKQAFDNIEGTGLEVRVTDFCGSACTLVLKNPRVCAERKAQFGFHQAFDINPITRVVLWQSEKGSKELWDSYPAKVRARVGSLKKEAVWIRGTELIPACK
jgi:hypothetical protein